jgi:hypothetical protein
MLTLCVCYLPAFSPRRSIALCLIGSLALFVSVFGMEQVSMAVTCLTRSQKSSDCKLQPVLRSLPIFHILLVTTFIILYMYTCVYCCMFCVLLFIIIIIISSRPAAQRGLWPPRSRGFLITHDAPLSVGLLWTSDQLVAETSI